MDKACVRDGLSIRNGVSSCHVTIGPGKAIANLLRMLSRSQEKMPSHTHTHTHDIVKNKHLYKLYSQHDSCTEFVHTKTHLVRISLSSTLNTNTFIGSFRKRGGRLDSSELCSRLQVEHLCH